MCQSLSAKGIAHHLEMGGPHCLSKKPSQVKLSVGIRRVLEVVVVDVGADSHSVVVFHVDVAVDDRDADGDAERREVVGKIEVKRDVIARTEKFISSMLLQIQIIVVLSTERFFIGTVKYFIFNSEV